jgi:RND family efflux transporter MFP subunit
MRYISPFFNSILIYGVCILLLACSEKTIDKTEQKDKYRVPVETVSLITQDIINSYQTTAVLEARAESKVTNKVSGMIEKVLVEEGMHVIKGQVLAEIDAESYQLEYEQATIELNSVMAEYNRSKPIDGRQLISVKDLEKLEFSVQSRRNQQKVAQIKVRDTKVRAPISGVIAQRSVKEGNMTAGTESEMFHIIDLDRLQGVVYLPETELNSVQIGQLAQLNFPANADSLVSANVALISPLIDTESGTFKVTLNVDNKLANLKPGMFAKVSLVLDVHQKAQVVPQRALLVTDTEVSLFVVADGKAKKIIVKTGYEQNGLVEILTPLSSKESIIVLGQQGLKIDSLVKDLSAINRDELHQPLQQPSPIKSGTSSVDNTLANAVPNPK